MKFSLLVNPVSGKGLGRNSALAVSRILSDSGHEVDLFEGDSEAASRDYLSNLKGCDGLLVAGGDGLVHLAIQYLANSDIPLGIIPCGTGNDAARSLGIPLSNPRAAVEVILNHSPKAVDLGRAESGEGMRWFLQILSTGFDSVVNERANHYRWPGGTMKYNRAMISLLPRFNAISYTMRSEQGESEFEAMLVAIANGPSYGGGMQVCPEASFSDGLLDVMILEPLGKWRFLALFPRVYRGSHIRHPRVRMLRVSSLTLDGQASTYADGERVGALPLNVDVVPAALRVWAPSVP